MFREEQRKLGSEIDLILNKSAASRDTVIMAYIWENSPEQKVLTQIRCLLLPDQGQHFCYSNSVLKACIRGGQYPGLKIICPKYPTSHFFFFHSLLKDFLIFHILQYLNITYPKIKQQNIPI